MDPQKNIYFKLQDNEQEQIVPRSFLLENNICLLISFY